MTTRRDPLMGALPAALAPGIQLRQNTQDPGAASHAMSAGPAWPMQMNTDWDV
jgi:hypothetical protein